MTTPDDIDPRDARIAELERQLAERDAAIAARDDIIAAQVGRIEALEAKLDELTRRLGLDSTSSSKPPSTDDARARHKRKRRKGRTGRAPGKQPGAPGHKRELWPRERVDHIVDHLPHVCGCGLELGADDVTGEPIRHQVFELPPKLVECTEHRAHACRCPGCGRTTRALIPAAERLGWGPRLSALLAWLLAQVRATRRASAEFVERVLGAPASVGSVQAALERASEALEPAWSQARDAVESDERVGCDETGWRLGRLPHFIWLVISTSAALFRIRKARTKRIALEALSGCEAEVVLTDRYSAYLWLEPERHQICRAHLLRDWEDLAHRPGRLGALGAQLCALERDLHAHWRLWSEGRWSWSEFCAQARALRGAIEAVCREAGEVPSAPAVVRWVLEEERGQRARCWTFLEHEGCELTNNAAERGVRRCVVQRKISWCSRSEAGLRLLERVWTVAETCRLQGRDVFGLMCEAMAAHRLGVTPPALL